MKSLKHITKYSLTLAFTGLTITSFAQDKPKDDPSISDEIEVVRPYKPVLADAVKIRRNPDLNDNEPFKPQLTYNILDKRQELNTDIKKLQAQVLVDRSAEILKNNYVKIGAGNMNGGLGEIYVNTGNDEALQAGFFLKHLNQEGSLNKQKFSTQQAAVFGRSILDENTLNGEVGFDRKSTYFYGFNPLVPSANADPAKQAFTTVSLKGEILKNYTEDQAFTYAAKANAYVLSNIAKTKETSFALGGFLNTKTWGAFELGANLSADFTNTKDALVTTSNNIAKLNPYARFQGNGYNVTLGVNFTQEFGDASRTNLLPALTAEVAIVPRYATLFAGFTGDVNKTSVRQLSADNPWINSNLLIRNAVEKVNIFGGIKGNAGSGFGYKAMGFYRSVQSMPLFVNNTGTFQKFDVIYDGGDAKIAGVEGEINLNTPDVFSWTGKVIISNYDMGTEKYAWFKPDFQLISNAHASINNKFIVNADVLINSETFAKPALATDPPIKVKSFVDLSGGAEYRFSNKIGLYLRVNNILGNNYQQYLYYSRLGLNVLGGFNFSF